MCWGFERDSILIYIIYTSNLGWGIAVFVREREQGRFRGSSGGAGGLLRGLSRGALIPGYLISWGLTRPERALSLVGH